MTVCERLTSLAPDHRIALEARRSLANYDANDTEALATVEALLRLFPEDIPLRLHKAGLLSVLRPHSEHLTYLQQQLDSKASDPLFALRLAQGLLGDAREHARALKLLRRVLRGQRGGRGKQDGLCHATAQHQRGGSDEGESTNESHGRCTDGLRGGQCRPCGVVTLSSSLPSACDVVRVS